MAFVDTLKRHSDPRNAVSNTKNAIGFLKENPHYAIPTAAIWDGALRTVTGKGDPTSGFGFGGKGGIKQLDPTQAMFANPDNLRAQIANTRAFPGQFQGAFNQGMAFKPQQIGMQSVGAQMAGADPRMQNAALGMLQNQAMGGDIAAMAANQRSQNLADSLAMAGSARDASTAGAMTRGAMRQQVAGNNQINQNMMGQQLAAQQAFAGAAGDARGLDAQLSLGNAGNALQAGMANQSTFMQTGQANQQAGLQGQQLKNNLLMQYMEQGLTAEQAALKAESDFVASVQSGYNQSMASRGSMFGGGAQGIGAIAGGMAMSDRRQKKNVTDFDSREFLKALSGKSYDYKDTSKPGTAEGRRFGIMAQDLERSEAGRSIVKETPHGKMVDVQQGFGLALAAMADLNKRISKMEGAA